MKLGLEIAEDNLRLLHTVADLYDKSVEDVLELAVHQGCAVLRAQLTARTPT